jgi:MinD superfamily P-loop ATPase
MIISVASGKGGTGKTSVAVALAQSPDGPVDLLDCDVEAPNGHIFMKPRWETQETIYAQIPEVDEAKCNYCRACSQLCQFKAILVLGETILTFPEMCHACGGCFLVCEPQALKPAQKELGTIEEGWAGPIHFVQGLLKVGEPMSPPLIREVKKRKRIDTLTILDAPPGTSCPVIQTVKGSDYTILVTEPTPFGVFDLKLAVTALETLNIPCGVILNRADMGNDEARDYLRSKGLPLLMEIPFDRRIAEGYARGDSLIETRPELKEKFQGLLEMVKRQIANLAKSQETTFCESSK